MALSLVATTAYFIRYTVSNNNNQGNSNMKLNTKSLTTFLCSLIFCLNANAGLILSDNNTQVEAGDSVVFDLILDLNAGSTFTGFGLNLDLSQASNLNLVNTEYASWLIPDDPQFSLTDMGGLVDFTAPAISGPGQYTLATLSFEALSSGSAQIGLIGSDGGMFEGVFYDDFSYEDIALSYNVQVNAVPEPGSIGAFMMGLLLLTFTLKKARKQKNATKRV